MLVDVQAVPAVVIALRPGPAYINVQKTVGIDIHQGSSRFKPRFRAYSGFFRDVFKFEIARCDTGIFPIAPDEIEVR